MIRHDSSDSWEWVWVYEWMSLLLDSALNSRLDTFYSSTGDDGLSDECDGWWSTIDRNGSFYKEKRVGLYSGASHSIL